MQIGARIKQARIHRGFTLKELGMMVGFDENTADVRIAQYESGTRTPKQDIRNKLGEALKINPRFFFDSHDYAAEDIMFLLFELDNTHKLKLTQDENEKKKVNIHIPYNVVDNFLTGWMEKKQALADEAITEKEYMEWKFNWPKSADKDKKKSR